MSRHDAVSHSHTHYVAAGPHAAGVGVPPPTSPGMKKYKAELKAIKHRSRHGSEQRARQELGVRELQAKLATREQDVLYSVGLGQAILEDLTRVKKELAATHAQAAAHLAPLQHRFATAAENFFALAEDAIEAKAAVLSAAALDSLQHEKETQEATAAALSQQLRQLQEEIMTLERDREVRTELDSGELYKLAAEAARLRSEVTTVRQLLSEKDAEQHAAAVAQQQLEGEVDAARRKAAELERTLQEARAEAADAARQHRTEAEAMAADIRMLKIERGRLQADAAGAEEALAKMKQQQRKTTADVSLNGGPSPSAEAERAALAARAAAWDKERAALRQRVDDLMQDLGGLRADNTRLVREVIPAKDAELAAAHAALAAAPAEGSRAPARTPTRSPRTVSPAGRASVAADSPVLALKDEVRDLRRRLRDVLGDGDAEGNPLPRNRRSPAASPLPPLAHAPGEEAGGRGHAADTHGSDGDASEQRDALANAIAAADTRLRGILKQPHMRALMGSPGGSPSHTAAATRSAFDADNVVAMCTKLDGLVLDLDVASERVGVMLRDATDAEAELAEGKQQALAENEALHARVKDLEAEVAALEAREGASREGTQEGARQLQASEAERAALADEVASLASQLADAEERCVILTSQTELGGHEVGAYKTKLAALQDDLADLRGDRQRLVDKNTQLAKRARAARDAQQSAVAVAEDLEARLKEAQRVTHDSQAAAQEVQGLLQRLAAVAPPAAGEGASPSATPPEVLAELLREEVSRLVAERQRVLACLRAQAADAAPPAAEPTSPRTLRESVQTLTRRLRAAATEVATLKVYVETEDRKNEALRAEIVAARHAQQTAVADLKEAQHAAAEKDAGVAALSALNHKLQEQTRAQDAELEKARTALQRLEGAGEQERVRARVLSNAHSNEVAVLQAAEKTLTGELELIRDQLQNTEKLCEAFKRERVTHEKEIASFTEQLAGLRADNASLRLELSAHSTSAKGAAEQLAAARTAEQRTSAEIDALRAKLEDAEQRCVAAQARVREEASEAKKLSSSKDLLRARAEKAEESKSDLRRALETSKARVAQLEGELRREKASVREVTASMATLRRAVEDSRAEARRHEQELRDLIGARQWERTPGSDALGPSVPPVARVGRQVPLPPTPVPPTPVVPTAKPAAVAEGNGANPLMRGTADAVELPLLRSQVADLRSDRAELLKELGRPPAAPAADVMHATLPELKIELHELRATNRQLRQQLAAEAASVSEDSIVNEPYGTAVDTRGGDDDYTTTVDSDFEASPARPGAGPLHPYPRPAHQPPASASRGAAGGGFWSMVSAGVSPTAPRELFPQPKEAAAASPEVVFASAPRERGRAHGQHNPPRVLLVDEPALDIAEDDLGPVTGEHAAALQAVYRDVHVAREEIQTMLSTSPARGRSASPVLIINEDDDDAADVAARMRVTSPVNRAMLHEQRRHQQAREANMQRVADALTRTLDTAPVYRHSPSAAAYALHKHR